MKALFQSKPLHLTACMLLFWKGISTILWIVLQELVLLGIGENFFFSTGFTSAVVLVIAAALSDSRTILILLLAVVCLAFLVYWVFFVLLVINRSGAGVASVVLSILCVLDLPVTGYWSFNQLWTILVCMVFHAALFITLVLLRRSRPGVPTSLSKAPVSI